MNQPTAPRESAVRRSLLLPILAVVAALAGHGTAWSEHPSARPAIRIDNGVLQVAVDSQCGQLTEFVDMKTGYDHIDPATTPGSLWQMKVLVAGKMHSLAADDAKRFSGETLPAPRKGLRLAWEDFPEGWAKGVRVEADVELPPGEPRSRWTIALCKPADVLVNEVRYPRILGVARREQERLVMPIGLGEELDDPRSYLCYGKEGKPV
ncbi:MAG: hypothetical protein GXX96_30325 [Planctomycetaceae bacterium]|nr:hypothetical protein [Planctomycetaceae bacterium]